MRFPSTFDSTPRDPAQLRALPPDALLTTREAALFCGFRSTSGLRKAKVEGRIRAAGRRGGRGTLVWEVAELRRFMLGTAAPERDAAVAPVLLESDPERSGSPHAKR